jgi:hypothetical protein
MKSEKINISKLQTVKNFASEFGVTPSYIYKLEKEGRMDLFQIDGVKFVQTDIYKTIPVAHRRK